MKTIIPPPLSPADVAGDYTLTEAEETLVILLLRSAASLAERYYGDPQNRAADGESSNEAEAMAHRIWREAGNPDRPTWEIEVLIGRRYGMEGCL
jgi:hypothetical protein